VWLAVSHPEAVCQIFNKENEITLCLVATTPKRPCLSISNAPKALMITDKQHTTPNSNIEKPTEHFPFSDLLNSQLQRLRS